MQIDILTLFPDMLHGFLNESIMKIAQEKGIVKIDVHNIRDYTTNKHKKVDDKPYGGGPGMVIQCEPVFNAIEAVVKGEKKKSSKILLTPQGRKFDYKIADELSKEEGLLLLCGHYEGFDERIRTAFDFDEISIGDYVLTGGELPALVIVDAVVRLIPCVLGDEDSAKYDSFMQGFLDFPHYTRPAVFREMKVPEILLSGKHKEIEKWRKEQAIKRTKERRKDLLD